MSSTLLVLLSIFFINSQAYCLDKIHYDFIEHLMQESPHCTVVLYKLRTVDYNTIFDAAKKNPILVLNDKDLYPKERLQDLLSVRRSYCALLFVQEDNLDESAIEYLLNQTKYRTVYAMSHNNDLASQGFQPYFLDSVVFIQALESGRMKLVSIQDSTNNTITWMNVNMTFSMDFKSTNKFNANRSTLRNRNITVSIAEVPPFAFFLPTNKYAGLDVDLFRLVAQKIGFDYTFRKEKYFIMQDPVTKQWSGAIASIMNGISQFGLIMGQKTLPFPYYVSHETYAMDFNYLVPKPQPLKPFKNFIRPFTPVVWICLLASWIVLAPAAYLFNKYGGKTMSFTRILLDLFGTTWQQSKELNYKEEVLPRYKASIGWLQKWLYKQSGLISEVNFKDPMILDSQGLWLYKRGGLSSGGLITEVKDSLVSPVTGAYYIIFGFWIIGMTFKLAAYSCNLRACMIMKEYEKPIETDEDIIDRDVDVYVPGGAGVDKDFLISMSPVKRKIGARMVKRNTMFKNWGQFGTLQDQMVREGGVMLVPRASDQYVLRAFEEHYGYQPLQPSKTNTLTVREGIGMSINQPWNDEVDKVILQLLAGGFVDSLYRRYVPKNKYEQDSESEDDLEPYRAEHVAGPLAALGAGLILSLVVFFFELAYVRIRHFCCIFTESEHNNHV